MTGLRSLALVLIGLLLTGAVFGASGAIAAERTALNADYVSDTFEQEGVYAEMTAEVRADVAADVEEMIQGNSIPRGVTVTVDSDELVARSITEPFVAEQMERSLRQIYGFLHGDRNDLDVVVDLTDQRATVSDAIVAGVEIDTPTLVGANSDRLEADRIAQLSEGPAEYEEAQLDLSDRERREIEEELETNVRTELDEEDENLTAAVLAHQKTVLDGLTGELTHEEYVDQIAADEQRIKTAVGEAAVDDVPETAPVFGEDEDPEAAFAPLARGVQLISTLARALPIVAVALVALGYAVSRSPDRTATMTAGALFWAGLVGTVIGLVLRSTIVGVVDPGGETGPVMDGLLAVVDGSLRTFGLQSILILAGGLVVFASVVAVRRDVLGGLTAKRGGDTGSAEPAPDEPGTGGEPSDANGADGDDSTAADDGVPRDEAEPPGDRREAEGAGDDETAAAEEGPKMDD